ncbi:WxL domain-containing protein [Enterococcus villorum]|uniref:Cell surface protein n=2 Tax=Enterococcus villorum TaxID=112904 RepID=A0A511J3F6_9ENTE|nr:WxL domain-containing protein [Enterococcus villorum]EOH92008.1 hypothetical protein UAO_00679 [Enterococcus villorum ATCC 700913]EOW76724.1 hypothetical protein I591_02032 [Enterococcus villorum ATCC 700913]GEL92530.1 cell surface protein [Enterococcus villorum]
MKKLTAVFGVSMLGATLMSGMGGFAAEVDSGESNGEVAFVTPSNGELTLDQVTSLDFDNHEIEKIDKSYEALDDHMIEVADLRGTSAGWNLQVAQSPMMSKETNTELKGASISLTNGNVATSNAGTAISVSDVTISSDNEKTLVLNAATGEGNGVTTVTYGKEGVLLNVPGKTAKVAEQYVSTLTWTLVDALNA